MRCHVITFLLLGSVAVFLPVGLGCRQDEYEASEGQCCPMCEKGTIVSKVCTAESGTQCDRCEDGKFMNERSGLTNCFSCSSCNAGQGLKIQQQCTTTTNTVCGVISGHFCRSYTDDSGCSFAEKHSHCAPGQRIKALGTNTNDTVCEDCEPGYYSQDGVTCTAWTICSGAEEKTKEGSPSEDVVCRNQASRHHYYSILSVSILALLSVGLIIKGKVTTKNVT